MFTKILSIFTLLFGILSALEPESTLLEPIQVYEMKLENGMTVFLKYLDSEEGIVSLQMAAQGGYAIFPEKVRAAARIMPDTVWYSGIGNRSSDELSNLLYQNSLEFNYSIEPYYHYLTGEAYTENVDALLKLIYEFFTAPHFDEKTLVELQDYEVNELKEHAEDFYKKLEKNYYHFNGIKDTSYAPLDEKEIRASTLPDVERTYHALFGDPSSFVVVIAGDFDKKTISQTIHQTLAKIPPREKTLSQPIDFQSIITRDVSQNVTVFGNKKTEESIVRLTFPMKEMITVENFSKIELMTQAIEVELRAVFKNWVGSTAAVDVSFELPLYPYLIDPWLIIQFRASPLMAKDLAEKTQKHLKHLIEIGLTKKYVEEAQANMKSSDAFWQQEASYWLNQMTNDYLFHWNPLDYYKLHQKIYTVDKEVIDQTLKNIHLSKATTFITHMPEE